jgi:hypothetical protein
VATRGPEEESAGKLFTHIENAQNKYFLYLIEIRTPITCFLCNTYS